MSVLQKAIDHAVDGFSVFGRNARYPRSRFEMGLGLSIGGLIALLFRDNLVLLALGAVCATLTFIVYSYAFCVSMKRLGERGDADYDKRGKFKLAKDYWSTESATAARRRRAK